MNAQRRYRGGWVALLVVAALAWWPGVAGAQMRVWVSDIHDQADREMAGEGATPGKVRIVGARNGAFSGKVVASGLKNLQAACGELKGAAGVGGVIPAGNIQIRYGMPWTSERGRAVPNACLTEAPLRDYAAPAAVWVTVQVPADAKAGVYQGELDVRAEGLRARVPVELKVADYTLPDPGKYVTWVDLFQVPDTSAVEYNVPQWSEKHWDYIGRALKQLGAVGNKTLYLPLIAHTNMGNAESMVRWVEKGQGKYEYDFTVVDKYLDLAQKYMGQPQVVTLVVWELYMLPEGEAMTDDEARAAVPRGESRGHQITQSRQAQNIKANGGVLGKGPLVTKVDASGKVENVYLPPYTDPASKALWAPLLSQMKQRLEKRGLGAAMMVGINSDAWASKAEVAFFNELTGNAPWVTQSHYGFPTDKLLWGIGKIGYQARVWGGIGFADGEKQTNQTAPVSRTSNHGWASPERVAVFERNAGLDSFPVARWRFFTEYCVTSTACGVGRVGADFWWALRNKQGERGGNVTKRFPEASWRNLNLCNSVLAAAPEGPAATDRFEAFREGLQESEARIVLERALLDPKLKARLSPELAKRAQEVLDERLAAMWKSLSSNPQAPRPGMWRWTPGVAGQAWFLSSNWQGRSEKLFGVAGEVARATDK